MSGWRLNANDSSRPPCRCSITATSVSRKIAFGVDAAMLCRPRSSGKPAFVIEYICRENRIKSVRSGRPPPRRRHRSSAASSEAVIGLISVGVMPRANKWLASDSAESDSSDPATASPRAVRPLYLKTGIALARQPRGRSAELELAGRPRAGQHVVEQALAPRGFLEPGERGHDLCDRARAVEHDANRPLDERHEARRLGGQALELAQIVAANGSG